MSRKYSTPWIYRRSRLLMAGIATIGAVGTAYLTVCESHINNPNAATSNDPYAITTTSGAAEMVLAQHLKQTEAKFYGAF